MTLPSFRSLNLAVPAMACALALLAGGCNRQSGDPAQPQPSQAASARVAPLSGAIDRSHKGSALPDFTLTDAAGKRATMASFKGKPLLVNLWATWCAPCVAELPTLDKLAQTRSPDLKVLTVSQDGANTENVAPFLAAKGVSHLEPWLDPHTELVFHYSAEILPTTIYYDAEGREVWRYVGALDWSSPAAAKMLAEAK